MAAFEFTPEITDDFYNKLAKGIENRGAMRQGQARSEALSRGLTGDPFEASATGAARAETDSELTGLGTDLAYNLAGMHRDERLTKEGRDYQSAESEKDRQFREKLARLGYDQSRDMEALQNRRGYQGALWNAGAQLGGKLLGAGAGKLGF